MSVSNRFELAPYLLVAVDFIVACAAAVAVLPLGVTQIAVPILLLLVVYASGEYSLLSEITLRHRVGVASGCLLFLCIATAARRLPHALWLLPWQGWERLGMAALGCLAFAAAHYGLERFLRARSQHYVFHLGPGMEAASEALRRHVTRSRYPAEILHDPAPGPAIDRLCAEVFFPRRDAEGDPARVVASFDPAHLCDVALRVLPPAVLALRTDYVDWHRHERRLYDIVKRGFDVAAAAALFTISLPLMGFAAIGIALSDGRPVVFHQARVGRFGRRFMLLKLRTLRTETACSENPNDAIEQRAFKFGAFLRRTRLDELPQFINVMRGDMSLVGPRPEMEYFHENWAGSIPFYHKRLLVRPGLSGWAQVRFPHTTSEPDYWDKTAYDLWYVAHRNAILDLRILLRTAGVMLFGLGAR
jgi:lipopolysaccharide/colanic/teichoic acid biosynthesis glycosyltransferase